MRRQVRFSYCGIKAPMRRRRSYLCPTPRIHPSPSMTFFSPLALDGTFGSAAGPVLGTPIYVTAANLGDGSGRKSIVAYHGGLAARSCEHAVRAVQSAQLRIAGDYVSDRATAAGFDIVKQRAAWPGCDLSFGSTCPGWSDGVAPGMSQTDFAVQLPDRRSAAPELRFVGQRHPHDGQLARRTAPNHYYTPAIMRPNASPGLQVLTGHGANGSDSIWLQGGGQVHEFVADNGLKLMRQRTVIDAAIRP